MKHFLIGQEESNLPRQLKGLQQIGYCITLRFSYALYDDVDIGEEMNHILQLAAPTEGERTRWLAAFQTLENKGKLDEDIEGELMVQDYKVKYWSPRHCILSSTQFNYQERTKRGVFPLTGCKVWSSTGFTFNVQAPSGKVLILNAESQDVRDYWIANIMDTVSLLDKEELATTQLIAQSSHELIEYTAALKHKIKSEQQNIKKKIDEFVDSKSAPPCAGADGKFRIISLDGGGMRGLINCIIFDRLLEDFPDLMGKVDMWVGTSNGGMLAMGFALGYTPKLCRNILEYAGATIFKHRTSYTGAPTNLNTAKFSAIPLKILCDQMCATFRLSQVPKYVVLPAFLLDNGHKDKLHRRAEIKYYHNISSVMRDKEEEEEEEGKAAEEDLLCSDVVMRTIAAPTYFPSYQKHVDGGMFAHSPASTALTYTISPQKVLRKNFEDVIMISLGTGQVNHYYQGDNHDWGFVQWLPKLTGILWDGMIQQSESLCKELLGPNYCRFNPVLEHEIELDDPMKIPALVELAMQLDLTELKSFIKRNFY